MSTEAIREKHIADQEGHTAHDTDAYFKARPNYERPLNRKHFEEGHRRGYEAGMQQAVKDTEELIFSRYEKKAAEAEEKLFEGKDAEGTKIIESLAQGVYRDYE